MATIRILGQAVREDSQGFQSLLAECYVKKEKERPGCMCANPPVPMYIAKLGGKFVLKRMPNSGALHMPICDSYDPPLELSGLGQVMGSAIQENPDEGTTALKFDFSLTKTPGKAAPVAGDVEHESVKAETNKLTLRSTLHYLWEEAGFNKWMPQMSGKRNWYRVRKYLLQAAENKLAKGSALGTLLYIPENFSVEHKAEIKARRNAQLMRIAAGKGARKLMIVIGEFKEFANSNYGKKLVLWHAADYHFDLNDEMHKKVEKVFATDFRMTEKNPTNDGNLQNHLITIATFSVNDAGYANIEEISFMPVDHNWIPFENMLDKTLLDVLYAQQRRFVKGMRYNMKSSKPLASIVLSDTAGGPTALYITKPGASEEYTEALAKIISDSSLQSWVWNVDDGVMPSIPV